MANFNEHALEMSIMELFKDEGYTYVSGDQIHRERTEVLLTDDLKQYLYNRYAKDGITPSEVDSVILMLRNISGTIYEANKAVFKLLCDGFILNREDRTQKDLYIELIDFDTPENNIFKAVNQFEIEGVNNQLRIPDGIVFVNGIPVVVLEFKSAVQENTTIMDAYKQLTIRYRRDIPEIFKYNAFVVISDGANNKYGSFFSPYDFFYAWRKINSDDKELDGINSLVTMIKGLFRKDRLLEVIKDFIYFPDNSDNSFKNMGIDYEEKAFYDILKAVSKKFEFEYPDDKMIELSKRIKLIVDDKSRYTDWSARDDIKANLQVDLILLLDEFGYPPVTIDDVYKEVLEQAENFKKYAQ